MRPTLVDSESQELLDRYGFVVVPFLDRTTMDQVREIYRDCGPAPDDPGVALYFGFHSASLEYKRRVSDAVKAVLEPKCAELLVDHAIYLAMFITKWPGENSGFGPHQDPTLVDERRFRGVSVWTPLVPTGVAGQPDNGVLHVVPGSHEFVSGTRVRNVDRSVFADHEAAILEHGVAVPTEPGEAIVFDNRVLHYSHPNQTDAPRPVVSLGVRPREASCVLPVATDDGLIDLYEVSDESWIEVPAPTVAQWRPTQPPIARVEPPRTTLSASEFEELCRGVGTAPRTVRTEWLDTRPAAVDPGAFCAFCGTTEGFDETDRIGRGKAQLVCASCARSFDAARPAR